MDTEIDLIDLEIDDAVVNGIQRNGVKFDEELELSNEIPFFNNSLQKEFCKKCDMAFPTWNAYFLHKLSDPRAHMCCYFCGKDFKTASGTIRHQRQDHAAEQDLTCVGCNARFNRAGAYVSHIEHKQCPVIHKTDFDRMRGEKDADQGGRQLIKSAKIQAFPERRNPTGDQRRQENRPNDAAEKNKLSLTEEEFPKLTAQGSQTPKAVKRNNDQSRPRDSVNPTADSSGAQEGAKESLSADLKNSKQEHNYHELDPDNPDFDISKYYNSFCDTWVCPWFNCRKMKKTSTSLVHHLKSHVNTNTESLRCPSCLAIFCSATALVQHSESQAIKCGIRESFQYRQAIDQMTGGLVDVDPLDERHLDNTIKYTSGKVMTSVNGQSTIADASKAYWAEQEERREMQIKEMEKTAKW